MSQYLSTSIAALVAGVPESSFRDFIARGSIKPDAYRDRLPCFTHATAEGIGSAIRRDRSPRNSASTPLDQCGLFLSQVKSFQDELSRFEQLTDSQRASFPDRLEATRKEFNAFDYNWNHKIDSNMDAANRAQVRDKIKVLESLFRDAKFNFSLSNATLREYQRKIKSEQERSIRDKRIIDKAKGLID